MEPNNHHNIEKFQLSELQLIMTDFLKFCSVVELITTYF